MENNSNNLPKQQPFGRLVNKPTAKVKPVIKQAPSIRENLERWKEPASSAVAPNSAAAPPPTANVQPQQIFLHSRSSSMHDVDEAKDELFQDDISTYINSQVTAQVLRRTSLKRKELCISPKRGINPNSYSQNQINRQNRRSEPILEISKSSAPLRDEDMIAHLNRPVTRRSVPPPETRRSQSISDLADISRNSAPTNGNSHLPVKTNPANIREKLRDFVKRRSLDRPNPTSPTTPKSSISQNTPSPINSATSGNSARPVIKSPIVGQSPDIRNRTEIPPSSGIQSPIAGLANRLGNAYASSQTNATSSTTSLNHQNSSSVQNSRLNFKSVANSSYVPLQFKRNNQNYRNHENASRPVSFPESLLPSLPLPPVSSFDNSSVSGSISAGKKENNSSSPPSPRVFHFRTPSDSRRTPIIFPLNEDQSSSPESPAADKPLPASPTSPTTTSPTSAPLYASQSQLASFQAARSSQRQLMKLDRCRSAENMTQLAGSNPSQRLVNAAAAAPIRRDCSYDSSNQLNPSQSMEVLREEEPQNNAFGQNITQRKARTPVRTNSEEDNNSTPNSSRRGSSIADKIRALGLSQEALRSTTTSPAMTASRGTLDSISENNAAPDLQNSSSSFFRPIRSSSESLNRSHSSLAEESFPDPPPPASETRLDRQSSLEIPVEIPSEISGIFDKIKRASTDPPEEDSLPTPQEPDACLLPKDYFDPSGLLKLNEKDANNIDDSDSDETSLSDVIMQHEKRVLDMANLREEVILGYRDNEAFGDTVNTVIKEKCPRNIVSKYMLFVEDIESNFKLRSKLAGRLMRAEASLKNGSHDLATTEALKQKYQVLKSQMSESEKCSNHCRQREAFVTEALQRQLEPDEFDNFVKYVCEKRQCLDEQCEIEEKIRVFESQLAQLKEVRKVQHT